MGHLRTQLTPPPTAHPPGDPGSQKQGLRALWKLGALFPRAPPEKDLWFGLQCGDLLKMQIMGTNPGVAGKAARRRGRGRAGGLAAGPCVRVGPGGSRWACRCWGGAALGRGSPPSHLCSLLWAPRPSPELLPRRQPQKPSTLASQGVWDDRRAGRRGGGMHSLLRWGHQSTKTWSCLPRVTATQ